MRVGGGRPFPKKRIAMERVAVVLAGGFGTRLQSVVRDLPKPMAVVAGRPFLTYVLDELIAHGFSRVILSTGYRHECIEDYFGGQYRSLPISYARELEPLGTGGGIWNAMQQSDVEYTFVCNGDTLFRADWDALERLAMQHGAPALALRRVDDVSRYGSVETAGDGRVLRFVEKQSASGAGFINGGIYLLPKSLFAGFGVGERFSFEKDILEKRVPVQPFYADVSDGYFIDIGIPEDYMRAQKELV